MLPTYPLLKESNFPILQRGQLTTLQVNLGYRCNQQCLHCHVNAGPKRTEEMDAKGIHTVLTFLKEKSIQVLDLTGGAPELNPHFRSLVEQARALGVKVIDRCNLTILEEQGQEGLATFLATNKVEVVASLPCYMKENVEQQRGKGVFEPSLAGLRQLNKLGYGQQGSELKLNLVYNPQDASLPPAQQQLEIDYKHHLATEYEIHFNNLFTLANMPIQRFGSMLISKGQFDEYMNLLKSAYQAENIASVMCRSMLSVDWQGFVYDCDFNQMLDMPLIHKNNKTHLSDLMEVEFVGQPIAIADHCYGCTAGQGSSCGGALGE
ncbi:MAG: arsenosugar biosynthesis radical SAM protein ArsS [Sulfuriflexus sp.]|nr:arsenosugar biosynthesis radical SAM protein ArsS [Sulfuriflexus sp.]